MSEAFLSTQLSLGTMSSQRTPSQARSRRGDIQPSHRLERYLASDMQRTTDQLVSEANIDPPAQQVIWGTTVNIEDSMSMFRDFLLHYAVDGQPYYNELLEFMNQNEVYDLNLDCQKLESYEPAKKLFKQLVQYPQEIIPLMDHVLTDVFLERFEASRLPPGQSLKVRPFHLPRVVNLRELNPEDIDQLITVKGLMIRTSPVIPDMKQAFFRCSVCDYTVEIENDRGRIMEPTVCNNNNCKSSNTMQIVHNRCVFADKQLCRLQETPDETPDGQTPYTVTLCSYDDLVDVAKPGDRVDVTGIFRAVSVRPNPRQRSINSLFKTYVDVVHIKKTSKARIGVDSSIVNQNEYVVTFNEDDTVATRVVENEEEILELSRHKDLYELLSKSIAPSIFGMEDVKKGVLLQLFGGSHKFSSDKPGSPRIRGDLNILLVGDPGVSKSQLLQYVHKLAPRGVYTSGKGSSAVGLTAYVTRDPDTKQLVLERHI
jgi:DNA replication licensing factor MCM4